MCNDTQAGSNETIERRRDEMRVRERQQATTTTSSIVGWLVV